MSDPRPPDEVLGYYARGGERDRLDEAYFPLERARTEELVRRHLPPPGERRGTRPARAARTATGSSTPPIRIFLF